MNKYDYFRVLATLSVLMAPAWRTSSTDEELRLRSLSCTDTHGSPARTVTCAKDTGIITIGFPASGKLARLRGVYPASGSTSRSSSAGSSGCLPKDKGLLRNKC